MKLPKQSAPIERFAAPSVKSTSGGVEASSWWHDALDAVVKYGPIAYQVLKNA
jgi:hypothetical protein